ncbi:hypothetical protein FXO38_25964 [Capsicum annuum]|nr:hypothetical protein FXO38_25964 [Capsicum annuum]
MLVKAHNPSPILVSKNTTQSSWPKVAISRTISVQLYGSLLWGFPPKADNVLRGIGVRGGSRKEGIFCGIGNGSLTISGYAFVVEKTKIHCVSGEGASRVVIRKNLVLNVGLKSNIVAKDDIRNSPRNFNGEVIEIPVPPYQDVFDPSILVLLVQMTMKDASKAVKKRDPGVLEKIYPVPFTYCPSNTQTTVFPIPFNILPGSRGLLEKIRYLRYLPKFWLDWMLRGEKESPCLMPLNGLKKFVLLPFTKIAMEEEVMQENILLDDDSMVSTSSIGQETSLSGADDALEDRLDSVGYDFSNNIVTSIIEYKHEGTIPARNCVIVLQNLCIKEDARIVIAEIDGCIASVVKLLERDNRKDQEHAMDFLPFLCSQQVQYCQLVMGEGVIPELISVSVNGNNKAKTMALELLRLLKGEFSNIGESHEPAKEGTVLAANEEAENPPYHSHQPYNEAKKVNLESTEKANILKCQHQGKKKKKKSVPHGQIRKGKRVVKQIDVDQQVTCDLSCAVTLKLSFQDPYFHKMMMKQQQDQSPDSNSQKLLIRKIFSDTAPSRFKFYSSSLSNFEDVQQLDPPLTHYVDRYHIFSSFDGLVLLAADTQLFLWNPLTRETARLPHTEFEAMRTSFGLGYDDATDGYKILKLDMRLQKSMEILTLKTGFWRKICNHPTAVCPTAGYEMEILPHPSKSIPMEPLVCVHGAFHWLGDLKVSGKFYVVSFSISNEVYEDVPLLDEMGKKVSYRPDFGISLLDGMLCFYTTTNDGSLGSFKLWAMKDYGVKES